MPVKKVYQFIVRRLRTRLNRPQYIMVVATATGLSSGLIAVLLKTLVHYIQRGIEAMPASSYLKYIFPVLGLVLTVFIIRQFFGGQIERGIGMVLRAIARRSSYIPRSHTYLHVITSAITVGFGGSAGLEAPIVATGSAVGSNLGRISDMNYRERTLLIACGAAAGIAAVFNAPIAGVIFAIEVLLTETIVSYFIPLIISSVVGALCSKIILKESILFNFVLKQNFNYNNVPFYILLGVLAGFVSLYYARVFKRTEGTIHNWSVPPYLRACAGGALLVILVYFFPPLMGEGYASVKVLAGASLQGISVQSASATFFGDQAGLIIFAALIVLFKPMAAGITIGSGGNGGNFAPSLFTGSYLGFFFSRLLNTTGWFQIPEGNFSLAGMAGVLSGVMYCPLTAIFLIAEVTNGYELFIPLMIVSSISFFIVKSYEPYREKNILTSMRLDEMLQDRYESIGIDKKLGDLVEMIKKSEKNIFAVHETRTALPESSNLTISNNSFLNRTNLTASPSPPS